MHYQLGSEDRLSGGRRDAEELEEIDVPAEQEGTWGVEADFVDAIRAGSRPPLTDFATGLRYMEFTEAVERSSRIGSSVSLPLDVG